MTASESPVGESRSPGTPTGGRGPVPGSPVAVAMARLDGIHELPLHEQPDVYQSVHAELQNALAAIDDA